MKRIVVLRIGHRALRDKRITTHVGLTARAFGAEGILLASDDANIVSSIERISKRWGGDFYIKNDVKIRTEINKWKENGGMVVHLTMYGLNLSDVQDSLKHDGRDLMIVIGAEKVPPEVYELADYNVAVGNQPHSEVAALAVLLDRISDTDILRHSFKGGELEIEPCNRGKTVISK